MTALILGIDPGVTGGLAFFFPEYPARILAEDIPVAAGEVDVDTLVARIRQLGPTAAVIERVAARPGQGVSSTFKFGQAYGALRAVCVAMAVPTYVVTPGTWKKHYRLDGDKERSRALAIQFWPGAGCFARKKDHGRAEAALLARYGAEKLVLEART